MRAALKALVFDMDGTLADTDPLHRRTFAAFLAPHGIAVDEAVYRETISGRTNAEIFADLMPDRTAAERDRLSREKEALFRAMSGGMEPLAGLRELIAWAEGEGLRVALVTNGPRLNVEHTLRVLGIAESFSAVVAGEDVARGKPDPLPYRTALDALGIGPGEAVAFEDSPAGIRAAKAAGIVTVGMLTGHPESVLREAGADLCAEDFRDAALLAALRARRP